MRGMRAGCARYEVAPTLSLPVLRAPGPRSTTPRKMLGGERGEGRVEETGAGVGKTGRNDTRPSSATVIVARNQTSRRVVVDCRRANPAPVCYILLLLARRPPPPAG